MPTDSRVNAFTVDLEEWFQGLTSTNPHPERWETLESRVVYATNLLLNLLRSHRVTATFFVLGHVAGHHPALIEQIAAEGHRLAIHGYYHRYVARLTPDEFKGEIERSMAALYKITGQAPVGHRAPYFSINAQAAPWAFAVLAAQGLQYDSSLFPARSPLYGYPGAPRFPHRLAESGLLEYPVSTVRLGGANLPMAGGFYVRVLPYHVIRQAIQHLNRQGQPAITYIHPWELDTGQRYNRVTPRERLTHYYGRRGLAAKIDRLLNDFNFGPLEELSVKR